MKPIFITFIHFFSFSLIVTSKIFSIEENQQPFDNPHDTPSSYQDCIENSIAPQQPTTPGSIKSVQKGKKTFALDAAKVEKPIAPLDRSEKPLSDTPPPPVETQPSESYTKLEAAVLLITIMGILIYDLLRPFLSWYMSWYSP